MSKKLVRGFIVLLVAGVIGSSISLKAEAALDSPEDYFDQMVDDIGRKKDINFEFSGRNSFGYNTKLEDFQVSQTGIPTTTIQDGGLYVGTSVLNNYTNDLQNLKTSSFSKSYTNSVTTQTTQGFMVGTEASAKFGIPLIGETEITLKAEYNQSTTNGTETSETVTYNVESQEISVPAKSKYYVRVYLQTATSSGHIEYSARPKEIRTVDGRYYSKNWSETPFKYTWQSLAEEASSQGVLHPNVSFDDKGRVKLMGKGTYSAEYGTHFVVEVSDMSNNRGVARRSNNKIVATYKIPLK